MSGKKNRQNLCICAAETVKRCIVCVFLRFQCKIVKEKLNMKKLRRRTKLASPEEVAISYCMKNEDPSGFLKVKISREIGKLFSKEILITNIFFEWLNKNIFKGDSNNSSHTVVGILQRRMKTYLVYKSLLQKRFC